MNEYLEISKQLISEEEIKARLGSIFVDSIVLRTDFRIKLVSKNLEELLEFTTAELENKTIDYLGSNTDLKKIIEAQLSKGYFENLSLELTSKSHVNLRVSVSGFYLGLISDINGYIILRIKLSDDHAFLQKELYKKTRELDSFIYRTAHDLRGPLATIKGLVNLLKMRTDNSEVDEFVKLIEVYAEKLDDRLYKLLYLADTDEMPHPPKGCLDFSILKNTLKGTLENNYAKETVLFFTSPRGKSEVWGINEFLITALINNLFLYVLSLPREMKGSIRVSLALQKNHLKIKVKASGFRASDLVRKAIRQPSFLYNDMLSYPLLVNYYAAQKVAMQLSTYITIDFESETEQFIALSIPIQSESQLPLL